MFANVPAWSLAVPPSVVTEPLMPETPDSRKASAGVIAFTTPPTAFDPYSSVAGPRTISMRSRPLGSTPMPWSAEELDKSPVLIPSSRISTLSPSNPRMIGRAAPGPKPLLETPGNVPITSAIVPDGLVARSNESTVSVELKFSNAVDSAPVAVVVTTMSS